MDITVETNNETQLLSLQSMTALMMVASHGDDEMVDFLLSSNAEAGLRDKVSVCDAV